jgi:ribokinase
MEKILVAGLINLETTLKVADGFPVDYQPVRYPFFGVRTTVSGVGYNVARALTALGDEVRLASLVGEDAFGGLVREALTQHGVAAAGVLSTLDETPQAVILYDNDGKRAIFTDLKAIQETDYPRETLLGLLDGVELAVLTNINFTRPYLDMVRERGIPIATDVHAISSLDDDYNRDYMAAADILFMSHERLPAPPGEWIRQVQARFDPAVTVIGIGAEGALLATREGGVQHVPVVTTRPVVSTVGAGDALFSAFVSRYVAHGDAHRALQQAVVFASWKIGAAGGADGFLDAEALAALCGE